MKVAFYTLGCKVNQYETHYLEGLFEQAGFAVVSPDESADVFVVNSCTVTAAGDRKTRSRVARFRRENPDAAVVLTGCFPQAFPKEAQALPDIDIVTGAANKGALPELVLRFLSDRSRIVDIARHGDGFEDMQVGQFGDRTRAFVKIQDGCNRFCSYCIIPKARGRVRSKPLCDIKRELQILAQNGYREVVLVGINLPCYGEDIGLTLIDAVDCACAVDGIDRVRLGSLEPERLSDDDLTRMAAQEKFCPQFHMSLQSGCDDTLKRMNRHYTTDAYRTIVNDIRRRFENPSITTDVIAGFPGETEEEFAQTLAFVKEIGFARVHVFAYSRREGTRAATMAGQIPKKVKSARSRALIEATGDSHLAFASAQIGSVAEVLLEQEVAPGMWDGFSKNYTPVLVRGENLHSGDIVKVKIDGVEGESCTAEAVQEAAV